MSLSGRCAGNGALTPVLIELVQSFWYLNWPSSAGLAPVIEPSASTGCGFCIRKYTINIGMSWRVIFSSQVG